MMKNYIVFGSVRRKKVHDGRDDDDDAADADGDEFR